MIGFFLRQFEANADQILQPAAFFDPTLRAHVHALRRLGALVDAPPPSVVRCPECFLGEVMAERLDAGCYGYCAECGPIYFGTAWLELVQLRPAWLFDTLRQQLPGMTSAQEREVVPGLLWQAGTLDLGTRLAAVLVARLPRDGDAERLVIQSILASYGGRPHIVLCSRASVLTALAIPSVRAVIAIEDVLHAFGERVRMDVDHIVHALDLPRCGRVAGIVSIADDGSWLRVGDRELRLRGKQRDFALVLVRAYEQGVLRPKREWVLRMAGYDAGITELRQITTREEFHTFFGYGEGEVWIRLPSKEAA